MCTDATVAASLACTEHGKKPLACLIGISPIALDLAVEAVLQTGACDFRCKPPIRMHKVTAGVCMPELTLALTEQESSPLNKFRGSFITQKWPFLYTNQAVVMTSAKALC